MVTATATLSIGDPVPSFILPDQTGLLHLLSYKAGKPTVLFFYGNDALPAHRDIALAFKQHEQAFTGFGAQVMGVSMDLPSARAAFAQEYGIAYPLLSDANGKVSREYGVLTTATWHSATASAYCVPTALLLDPNLRVVKVYQPLDGQTCAAIAEDLRALCENNAVQTIAMQAPVLMLPNVLTPDYCQQLINLWHTSDTTDAGIGVVRNNPSSGEIEYRSAVGSGIVDRAILSRKDHIISDMAVIRDLYRILVKRVYSEIRKAFSYQVVQHGQLKISCYDAAAGGFFKAHRDNMSAETADRVWAMSLTLNTGDYEGGYLRFPEYVPHSYNPGVGCAVIFSCSLLHEITPVTAGRRFVLINFMR